MKKIITIGCIALLAASTAFLTSCGQKKTVLRIYSWGDYFAQDILDDFEKKYDCTIQLDEFDSNESMYAKVKAGGGGYDLIVMSTYTAKLMYEQGMLEKMDHSKLATADKYFDKKYEHLTLDPKLEYTVPYFASFTGIGYDSEKVKDFEPTWAMFEREDLKGRTSLLDDHREVIGCALITLGYDVNETDQAKIDQAVELANKWKKQIAKFGVDDTKQSLASGEFLMIQTYSGDVLQVSMEKPSIKFVIPKEGTTFTFDNFTIMKDSKNKDLAYEFINFIYEPENAVKDMEEIQYVLPHTVAVDMVDEEIRNNPAFKVPEETFERCHLLLDLGDDNTKYLKAWDRIREE
ncbi:MAG: spermidine/putrescine ABC transporter substrate-binding protein [Verrucomicrobia bacterium]|nr:spermidine/putrescine ABC transporter substrate-binding protein [Verrucomicrobiota bacterium]